jgi:hypothetical protein
MKSLSIYLTTVFILITMSAKSQFITNNGLAISNSALVVTNGSWTNAAGTNIINNGIIQTSESFTNAGALNSANGGFILLYGTDLDFKPGSAQLGSLTKAGAGAAKVDGTISLRDSLILKGGIIQMMKPTDTISIQAKGILKSAPSAYVDGLVARAGVGILTFPLGKDGHALRLTLHKVNAQKIVASVVAAPASPAAGPGVDALINFPYAWRVKKKVATDTAAYVELNYPDNLPVVANPIVVRETTPNVFSSMGARFIDQSAGRVTVQSYSRGLNGLYTIAQGFPKDPVTDSLALIALYNSTNGASWANKTNWTKSPIDSWFGVTVTGQTITAIQLPSNNVSGPVADQLTDIEGLQIVDLSHNNITAFPDFTETETITQLDLSNNKLDFSSLEPNATVTGLGYTGQAAFGLPVDSLIEVGSPYTLSVDAGGNNTSYQWLKNDENIQGAIGKDYVIASLNRATMGTYAAVASNSLLPLLKLNSEPQKILAYASISGTLYDSINVPASRGKLTLFRINTNAYDTTAVINVKEDGSFKFDKVVLDNYQLLEFADTLTYERALPTYYKGTIFWEEADTIFLENHLTNIEIVTIQEPLPPAGHGIISGYLQQDDGTGRVDKPLKPQRVASAGVSARRVQSAGRSKENKLILVSYVFTNANGEFSLTNLPEGKYVLNIQYPGYPMDTTSFIAIDIGSGLQSQVQVEAQVAEGKISVRMLTITGVYERQDYHVDVYPNPVVETIHLKFGMESQERQILLLDINGKTMIAEPAKKKEAIINVSSLNRGLYLLQVRDKNSTVKTMKVSIE